MFYIYIYGERNIVLVVVYIYYIIYSFGVSIYIYVHIYMIISRSITPQHIKYNSKPLDVAQSLYFGSKLPSSGTKAACCRNMEIVLHPTALSYIYVS